MFASNGGLYLHISTGLYDLLQTHLISCSFGIQLHVLYILAFSLIAFCGSLPKYRLGRCSTVILRCMGTQVLIDFSYSFVAGPDGSCWGVFDRSISRGPSVLSAWAMTIGSSYLVVSGRADRINISG